MSRRGLSAVPALAAVVALGGCGEIPTAMPGWDTRWIAPFEGARIEIAEFLPEGVRVRGSTFGLDLDPASFGETLGVLCPSCAHQDPPVDPKPAFQGIFAGDLQLPDDVHSAAVGEGEVAVTLANDMDFDPLRPGGGDYGSLILSLVNDEDGRLLSRATVAGEDTAFPPGESIIRNLSFGAGRIGSALSIEVRIDSPEGDPAPIRATRGIRVEAVPSLVRATSAGILLSDRTVRITPARLDLGDMDESLQRRVEEGFVDLDIENPFGIEMTLTLGIGNPGMNPVERNVRFGPGTSAEQILLSGEEVRSFLADPEIVLTGIGQLTSVAGVHEIGPAQAVALAGSLGLIVRFGRQD